jgi:hypothetical protein
VKGALMNGPANGLGTVVVAGSGEASSLQPDLFEARTRATVRYADPAAWITAAAVAQALAELRDLLTVSLHEVGVIVVSDQGPTHTMAEVNATTATGFSSPLRYAASSPGSLAGVTCIAFGFRGPTLNFTMLPDNGVPVALKLCTGWLTRRVARYMVLATFRAADHTTGFSRAVLLAHPELSGGLGNLLTLSSVSDWLIQIGD